MSDEQYLANRIYDEVGVGDSAELERVLTRQDIQLFAVMAGDASPTHLDPEFANESRFQGVIGHGMWLGALISTLLGNELPGPGTIYVSQSLAFQAPVHLGDQLLIRITCAEKLPDNRLRFTCEATNQKAEQVLSGEAVVLAPLQRIHRPRPVLPRVDLHDETSPRLQALLAEAKTLTPLPVAVVHPLDLSSLSGALVSRDARLIEPLLVGPEPRIRALADEHGLDLADTEIIHVEHSHAAAERAVALVHEGRAEGLMKGKIHTDEFIRPVLSKTGGLRTGRRFSHVMAVDVSGYHKPLYLTDCALNIRPDLMAKKDICQNAIDLFRAINGKAPKVALLAAVETVDATMPSTLDATALCKMADRGQIVGGLLDGPLAMDNAISEEAAKSKGIVSAVAGDADILVFPDLESGNMAYKQMSFLSGAEGSGIVLGARVPIILTSRSSGIETRLGSAAMALVHARRAQ